MRTPDSHRIRTIRYRSPPPDPVGLQTICVCKGYLNSKGIWWARNTIFRVIPGPWYFRVGPGPESTNILPFHGIPWKYTDWVVMPTQAGPCFWGYTRMPRCLSGQWMPLSPRFVRTSDEIRNWRHLWDPLFDIYTRDWPSKLIDHFGQIDCADILIPDFFLAFSVICEIIIVLFWDESSWLEINYLRNGHWEIESWFVLLLEFGSQTTGCN